MLHRTAGDSASASQVAVQTPDGPDYRRGSKSALWFAALMLAILAFYLATIRTGHHWGDDYALYVHHAKNLATGVPYTAIGYIADPDYPTYSVRMAPPVFPFALAAVYKIFGMNFTAFKVVGILFFVGALALLLAYFRDYLTLPYRLLLVAIMGFNPFFWNAKDNVVSDVPFFFFTLLTAWLVEEHRPAWQCGIAAYLAIGTRTIGVVLVPAIIIYDLIWHKRITKYSGIAVATYAGLAILQRLVLHGDTASSYVDLFRPSLEAYVQNFRNYPFIFADFWLTPVFWMTVLICGAVSLLAIRGIPGKQPLFFTLFVVLYGIALLLWPGGSQEARYLIPIFVLFLFYAVRGMQRLGTAATVAVCLLLSTGFALEYRTQPFKTINEANGRETFVAMCSWVRGNTAPGDRFVFNRARTLSLFTDRAVSPYHEPQSADALWEYFRSQNIQYVVASNIFEKDRRVLVPLLESHKNEVEPKYENSEFAVYWIRRGAAAPTPQVTSGVSR